MNAQEALIIESECAQLIHRFAWATDAMDYDAVTALFVPDCVFSRADKAFQGIEGLGSALNARPRDRMTRHICSNLIIDVIDGDHARGKAYCLVFGHRGELPAGAEAPLTSPDSLILYEADFQRNEQGWRFKRFHIGLSFRKPAAA